ncbi:unnamed protein product [Amoebophrya sp. A120]|nr:unnamed protein product [Amoebophrya sp. A120]|eukprot:GSA120T00008927001.1
MKNYCLYEFSLSERFRFHVAKDCFFVSVFMHQLTSLLCNTFLQLSYDFDSVEVI